MTPGTLVLLHSPLTTAATWGALPERLRASGMDVAVPEITDDDRAPYAGRYIARAALDIAAYGPAQPLVLLAHSGAGPLLPALGMAQRAAHRRVGGYVFCDAGLPVPGETTRLEQLRVELPAAADRLEQLLDGGGRFPDYPPPAGLEKALRPRGRDFFTDRLPPPQDWPDAPCGYLRTSPAYDRAAGQARHRGWPVIERESGHFAAYTAAEDTAAAVRELIAAM
jgi:alpha/beta hydrolase family protein